MDRYGKLLAFSGILLILFSCTPTDRDNWGSATSKVLGDTWELRWKPLAPRVGDRVQLEFTSTGATIPGELVASLGTVIYQGKNNFHSLFLVRTVGDFQPEGWPGTLWTVPDEKTFPQGIVTRTPEELFKGEDWFWLLSVAGIILLGMVGGVFLWLKKKPVAVVPVVEDKLESFKSNLHERSRSELREVYHLMDPAWALPDPAPGLLAQAWFSTPSTTWGSLRQSYEERKKILFYSSEAFGWEEAEKDLDVVLFRKRNSHV